MFTPHDMEGNDNTHIEGLAVLAAVGSATTKLTLGSAMAICHRHPIHLAQSFAGLSRIANGRVIMGLSVGGFPHEFAAAGLPTTLAARAHLASTNADLCRRLWRGEKVSYQDDYYSFANVELKPAPVNPIPIWGGGSTPAACRRVVEYCDGWMPARITLETFKTRLDYIRDLSESAGRHRVTAAVMPLTSIANDRATALSHVHVQALLAEAKRNATWVKPAGGSFSTLEDIKGLILAGTASDIVRETRAFQSAGAELIVFDLRFRYRDWFQQIELLGELVLPEIRAGGNSAYQRDQR